MLRRITKSSGLLAVSCLVLALHAALPAAGGASTGLGHAVAAQPLGGATPGIDPAYIYSQLDYLATRFQHREAGYRAGSAGQSGFARYWEQQMLRLLGPFGAQARSYRFPVTGWVGRPATAPAADVEVTVPGLASPSQVVVIGCHYDGEADSTQSAYDDASGCAIELGVAKSMAAFWSAHHFYPARTLRFVIFDAEEQGLFGSYHYVSEVARNDLRNISLMINEEQNGIAYPLRYLGKSSNPLMPFFAYLSPLSGNKVYPHYTTSPRRRAGLLQLRTLMRGAVAASFGRYRAMGDQMLTYHSPSGADVWQPVFSPGQLGKVHVLSDTLGSSDQVPFTAAGVRSATFVGNATYYENNPPPGSYPYDRPEDTVALMNTYADGGRAPSHALELALSLPGMLTTWLLSQPTVLGVARPDGRPVAAISDIGVIGPGRPATFTAAAAYVPGRPGAPLRYSWDFGDGQTGTGRSVRHVYRVSGRYTLRLSVAAGQGRPRVISRRLLVAAQVPLRNPYSRPPQAAANSIGYLVARGMPPTNPAVELPVPTPGMHDRVGTAAQVRRIARARAHPSAPGPAPITWALVSLGAVLVLASLVLAVRRGRRN